MPAPFERGGHRIKGHLLAQQGLASEPELLTTGLEASALWSNSCLATAGELRGPLPASPPGAQARFLQGGQHLSAASLMQAWLLLLPAAQGPGTASIPASASSGCQVKHRVSSYI